MTFYVVSTLDETRMRIMIHEHFHKDCRHSVYTVSPGLGFLEIKSDKDKCSWVLENKSVTILIFSIVLVVISQVEMPNSPWFHFMKCVYEFFPPSQKNESFNFQ